MTEQGHRRWPRLVAEFFVIIVGVLVALAVDQWRESRLDRELEREYLLRLRADLEETRTAVENVTSDFNRLVAHGIAVARVLDGSEPFPVDTLGFLASALQVSRGGYDPAVSRGAYDDLISTGNLRVIQNEALRYGLSSFYGQVMSMLSPVDYSADKIPYRNTIRGLLTLETQLLIRAECDGQDPLSCVGYSGRGGFREMVEAVLAAPGIRSELTVTLQGMAIRTLEEGVTGGFSPVVRRIDDLLDQIAAEDT